MATKKKVTVEDKQREMLANELTEDTINELTRAALGMTFLKLRLQKDSDIE